MPQAQWPKVLPRTLIVSDEDHLKTIQNMEVEVFHQERGNAKLDLRVRKLERAPYPAVDLTDLRNELTIVKDQTTEAVVRLERRVERLEKRVDNLGGVVLELVHFVKHVHEETHQFSSDPRIFVQRMCAVQKRFVDKLEEKDVEEKSEKE